MKESKEQWTETSADVVSPAVVVHESPNLTPGIDLPSSDETHTHPESKHLKLDRQAQVPELDQTNKLLEYASESKHDVIACPSEAETKPDVIASPIEAEIMADIIASPSEIKTMTDVIISLGKAKTRADVIACPGEAETKHGVITSLIETEIRADVLASPSEAEIMADVIASPGEAEIKADVIAAPHAYENKHDVIASFIEFEIKTDVIASPNEAKTRDEVITFPSEAETRAGVIAFPDEAETMADVIVSPGEVRTNANVIAATDASENKPDVIVCPSKDDTKLDFIASPIEAEIMVDVIASPSEAETKTNIFASPGEAETIVDVIASPGEAETTTDVIASLGESGTKLDVIAASSKSKTKHDVIVSPIGTEIRADVAASSSVTETRVDVIASPCEAETNADVIASPSEAGTRADVIAAPDASESKLDVIAAHDASKTKQPDVLAVHPSPQVMSDDSLVTGHVDIAKYVQRILHPTVPRNPSRHPPSIEYMNKTLNCSICKVLITDTKSLLVCDACEGGYHLRCLQPYVINGMKGISTLEWYCLNCLASSKGNPLPPKYGQVNRAIGLPQKVTLVEDSGRLAFKRKLENEIYKLKQKKVRLNIDSRSLPHNQSVSIVGARDQKSVPDIGMREAGKMQGNPQVIGIKKDSAAEPLQSNDLHSIFHITSGTVGGGSSKYVRKNTSSTHVMISQAIMHMISDDTSGRAHDPSWTPLSLDFMNKPLNCSICQILITDEKSLLVCDACEGGYHLSCLRASGIARILAREWHCQRCLEASHGRPLPPKYGRVDRKRTQPKPDN